MPVTRSASNGTKNPVEPKTLKKTKAKREATENVAEAPPAKTNKTKKAGVGVDKKTPIKEKVDPEIDNSDDKWKNAETIYEFIAKDIKGNEVSLDKYKGHVCIIVNVASKCGHTKSNYEQFVEVFDKYSDEKGLKILAFPCNQFGKQEPDDNEKICQFSEKRNVKFDMFEKIDVNGENAHPLWKFLTSKINGSKGEKIDWNFTKFIIDKEGKVVERFGASMKPLKLVENLENYW